MSARAASETRILAVHAFSYRMYERNEWYPVIGFDKELFGEELVKSTRRLCGNAFTGVCDADLPPIIVRESAFSKKAEIHLLADAQHACSGHTEPGADGFPVRGRRRHIPAHAHLRNGRALARRLRVRVEAGARSEHWAGGDPRRRRPRAAVVVAAGTRAIRARPRAMVSAHPARRRHSRKPLAKTDRGALALEMFRQLQALRLIVRADALPV